MIKEHHAETGYIDVLTIQARICFSGKKLTTVDALLKAGLWKVWVAGCPTATPEDVRSYLEGLEIVRDDFRNLLAGLAEKRVLLLDPPYLFSENHGYVGSDWRMRDFLELIGAIQGRFVLFSHEASGCIDFINWLKETHNPNHQAFQNIEVIRKDVNLNKNVFYSDFMIVGK